MSQSVSGDPLDLDAIEQRLRQIDADEYNQGVPQNAPWRPAPNCSGLDRWIVYQPIGSDQNRIITEGVRQPFADFIAAARSDVPALVAEVRSLRQENERCRERRDDMAALTVEAEAERDRAVRERDHARAEWHRHNERADDLRAEVKHWRHVAATAKDQRDTAEAEVRRLRGALQAVRDRCAPSYKRAQGGALRDDYERGAIHALDEVYRLLDAALDGAE